MSAPLQSVADDPIECLDRISRGLSWRDAEKLASLLGISISRLRELLQISPTTMTRRKSSRFTPLESDRLLRFHRLWHLACESVGGAEGARSWLSRPQFGLKGRVPLDLAQFEVGEREVEKLLERILHGVLT